MTPKERVLTSIGNKEPDRVPLDIGGFNNSTMHYLVQQELQHALGLPVTEPVIIARSQGIVVPDENLLDFYGVDTRSIYIEESIPWRDNGDGTFTDMWGIGHRLNPDGYYYNMCHHPLADADSVEDIEAYVFPELNSRMLAGLKDRIKVLPDKCLILEGFRECLFGLPSWLRGLDNFYMDLASEDDMCLVLLDRILEFYLKWVDFVLDELGEGIDIVKFADDMGAQNAMILSPDSYRAHIKPRQAKLYGHVKEKYGKKILLHSCGSVRSIIDDLIEIGVDILNPVQISAAEMSPATLKDQYGGRIAFWGGGVDTQQVLNAATPEYVKEHVADNIRAFKPGGGYVFCQVHNIMPGVPVENIMAMYDAYKENAAYQ